MTNVYYHSLSDQSKTTFGSLRIFSLILVATFLFPIFSCGKKDGGRDSGGAGGSSEAPSDPAATPEPGGGEIPPPVDPDPEPSAPLEEPTPEPTPVPPITPDTPYVIETGAERAVKNLIFESGDELEAGRYLDEYLIAIKASEPSCIRLKVRPTDGVEGVPKEALPEAVDGQGACSAVKVIGEANPETSSEGDEASDGEEEGDNPNLALRSPKNLSGLSFGQKSLRLAAADAKLCDARIFRMETLTASSQTNRTRINRVGRNTGLETVVSKTGRLIAVGNKVRVWVDDEFANYCTGGTGVGDPSRSPIAFGPLREADANVTDKDKLYQEQIDNIVSEMDKIYDLLTGDLGTVSDIDGNGFVEIFLSPDVNRRYLYEFNEGGRSAIDDLGAAWIYKPEDLAKFDSETNPASNEGEILYLWTPDPAGIYQYGQFASSNSLTSNYARGFLTAQLMNLVIANQKILVQKSTQNEALWLSQTLSLLAASYYAGNEYPLQYLIQFYSSRPHTLSLTEVLDDSFFSNRYINIAINEQIGMRAVFGWYLHSRWCGANTSEPCANSKANIKALLSQPERGTAAIEAILNQTFPIVLNNFALSVGISLQPNPTEILTLWDNGDVEVLPPKPYEMAANTVIRTDNPQLSRETSPLGVLLNEPETAQRDGTVAGPIPSYQVLVYQPLLADSDVELKLDQNSVSYVLVTGLVEKKTDITGIFGPGLSVTFIPVGERDPDTRRIHVEKVSELAHDDFRPDNLTSSRDQGNDLGVAAESTVYGPVYENLDFRVTADRELWIVGSIDERAVDIEDSLTSVSDEDTYIVEFDACEGLSGQPLATCQSEVGTAQVVAQVYVRDFEKELAPMLMVTPAEREIFRGHTVLGRLDRVTPPRPDRTSSEFDMLCPSQFDTTKVAVADFSFTAPNNTITLELANADHGIQDDDVVSLTINRGYLPPRGLNVHTEYFADVDDTDPRLVRLKSDINGAAATTGAVLPAGITLTKPDASTVTLTAITVTATEARFAVDSAEDLVDFDFVTISAPGPLPHFYNSTSQRLISARGATFVVKDLTDDSTEKTFQLALNQQPNSAILTGLPANATWHLHSGSKSICSAGGIVNKPVFDHETTLTTGGYRHNYYNYISLGEPGFPFTTRRTVSYGEDEANEDEQECESPSCYREQEAAGQFFQFAFSDDFDDQIRNYSYYGLDGPKSWPPKSAAIAPISDDDIERLVSIKQTIDLCLTSDPQSQPFVESCSLATGASELACTSVCGEEGADVQAAVLRRYDPQESDFGLICKNSFCPQAEVLLNAGEYTAPWIPYNRFFNVVRSNINRVSYQFPVEPEISLNQPYCLGSEASSESDIGRRCQVARHPDLAVNDIRSQLHVEASELMGFDNVNACISRFFGDTLKVCFDFNAYELETGETNRLYVAVDRTDPNTEEFKDRSSSREATIHDQLGEILAKPERIAAQVMAIKTASPQKLQFTVGGRKNSQGKYLLRLRFFKGYGR